MVKIKTIKTAGILGIMMIIMLPTYLPTDQQEKSLFGQFMSANRNFEQGKKYFYKNKIKQAEKDLKKCLEKYPEHADAFFYLSQIYYKKGRLQEALRCIENAENNLDVMINLIRNYKEVEIRKYRKQKNELEQYLQEVNILTEEAGCDGQRYRPSLESELIEIHEKIENLINQLNHLSSNSKHIRADYTYFYGNILFKLKKFSEAQEKYLQAIQLNPKHKNAYNNLINLYTLAGHYKKAHLFLSQAEDRGVEVNQELKRAVLKSLKQK